MGETRSENFNWAQPRSLNWQISGSRSRYMSIRANLPTRVGDKDGVIIVDHGSRRKESNLMLSKLLLGHLLMNLFFMGIWYSKFDALNCDLN